MTGFGDGWTARIAIFRWRFAPFLRGRLRAERKRLSKPRQDSGKVNGEGESGRLCNYR